MSSNHGVVRRNIVPKPANAAPSRLEDNDEAVREFVRHRTFTPIIGGGCSAVGRSGSSAWRRIAWEVDRLILDKQLPAKDARDYLRSLANAKLVPPVEGDAPQFRPHPEALHKLRRDLVRVGWKAGVLFGAAMVDAVEAVTDSLGHRVTVGERLAESFDEFIEYLALACVSAHDLRTDCDPLEL
jgi:hypothetical protein